MCKISILKITNMDQEIKELKLYSWIGGFIIVIASTFPKMVYKFNTTTLNIPLSYIEEKDIPILKYM